MTRHVWPCFADELAMEKILTRFVAAVDVTFIVFCFHVSTPGVIVLGEPSDSGFKVSALFPVIESSGR
jgi:hypothetical protein